MVGSGHIGHSGVDRWYGKSLPQPEKVASLPVLARMSSIGIFSWYCIYIKPPKSYYVSDATVTALADDLDALPTAAMPFSFQEGVHRPERSRYLATTYLILNSRVQKFLFQLSPIQHAFRGNTTRPGRELDGGKLVFGQKGNGVALVLQQDLKKSIVSHNVSGQLEPLYPATAWRGDWRVEIEVGDIEVWTEQQLEDDDDDDDDDGLYGSYDLSATLHAL